MIVAIEPLYGVGPVTCDIVKKSYCEEKLVNANARAGTTTASCSLWVLPIHLLEGVRSMPKVTLNTRVFIVGASRSNR